MSMQASRIAEEQLTAYVMGELTAAERQSVEAALQADPLLRAEADELRRFCGRLWDELKEEPSVAMNAAEQAAFVERLAEPAVVPLPRHRRWSRLALLGAPLAAAAVAVFLVYKDERDAAPHGNAAEELSFVPAAPEDANAPKQAVPTPVTPTVLAEKREMRTDNQLAPSPAKARAPASLADLSASGGARQGQPLGSGRPSTNGLARAKRVDLSRLGFGVGSVNGIDGRPAPSTKGDAAEGEFNTEAYDYVSDNPFHVAQSEPLSTFSVDVDTAAYANMRRFISGGALPPKDAVRIEELINYFRYDYAAPADGRPFAVNVEVTAAPWAKTHRLVRIGIKGQDIAWDARPTSNLVFLLDVSGSMNDPQKLPLVKQALRLLVEQLGAQDRVAVAVYAGASGLVLPSTSAAQKTEILAALERLEAGGSTNGGEGLRLAYKTAREHFVKGGVNRVIVATDGDFNMGTTNQGDLVRLIETEAKSGVFLSVLGFGMGNYKDATLEKLADKGNGNYAYIDSAIEARKALVEEAGGTLVTIAKDVKLQLEFNPATVTAYRLIGYENRVLAHQDFNNDQKDAGDIGAGHTVTALYEVVPSGVAFPTAGTDPLKYRQPSGTVATGAGELLTLKLRYKQPEASKSSLIEYAVKDKGMGLAEASGDTRFAAGVAAFGMLLRGSEHKGTATYDMVLELAEPELRGDRGGYRAEFVELVKKAKRLPRP